MTGVLVAALVLSSVGIPHARRMKSMAWGKDRLQIQDNVSVDKVNPVINETDDELYDDVNVSLGEVTLASADPPILAKETWSDKVDEAILVGQKVWDVVKKGEPVKNIESQAVSVVPANVPWMQMESWKYRAGQPLTIVTTRHTGFGHMAVSLKLTPSCFYGGSYEGTGQYLKDCKLIPTAYVDYLHFLDCTVTALEPHNAGTISNPIAMFALIAEVKWGSVFQKWSRRAKFVFRGDGYITATFV